MAQETLTPAQLRVETRYGRPLPGVLHLLYWERFLTIRETASAMGVERSAAHAWLTRFGLSKSAHGARHRRVACPQTHAPTVAA